MQVDPVKPALKAPGTQRLKLNYDYLLTSFAFNFNLRRYNKAGAAVEAAHTTAHHANAAARDISDTAAARAAAVEASVGAQLAGRGLHSVHFLAQPEPFLYTLHTP